MDSRAIDYLNKTRGVSFLPVSDSVFEGTIIIHETEVKLRIDLGSGFPNCFPVITLMNHDKLWPHVSKDGKICLFEQESIIIKESLGNQVLIDAYDRAIEILSMDMETRHEELLREFMVYWSSLVEKNYRLCINLPLADDHEFHKYEAIGPGMDCMIVSPTIFDSKALLLNSFHYDSNLAANLHIPCYRIRLRACALPKMSGELTWNYMRSFILENITAGQKRDFRRMLEQKTNPINRIIIVSIPSKYGDQNACIWLHAKNPRKESLRNISNCRVDPVVSFRIDSQYLITRGGGETDLLGKKILIVGCGSVGGFLAENLCRCGIGSLDILDKDKLSIDNVHRHVLGFSDAVRGDFKSDLLKAHLESCFPHIDIDSMGFVERTAEAFFREPERSLAYDLIVSATGNPTVDLYINSVLRQAKGSPPFVVCFNEPYGIGGHAVAILNNGGCLRCLYSDIISGELVPFQGSFVKAEQVFTKSLSGCVGSYVEYSVLDSQQTAIIACRLIIDILKGKRTSSRLVSWIGNPDKLREAGFETSDHYLNLEEQGKTLFEIDVQSMPRCKTCRE